MWLAAVVVLVTLPLLQPLMAQQASRYALTAAIVDDATVRLDAYAHFLSVDHARHDGHLYSDKAPGQPVWGVPAYAAYRALGGSPAAETTESVGDLGLWAVSVWSAALPAALLAPGMRRLALRAVPGRPAAAGAAALSLALGTLLLPFATQLFGHVLAATLGLGAWLCGTGRPSRRRWLAAGALAGAAVTVEYPMILVAVVVLVGTVWHAVRAAAAPPVAAPTAGLRAAVRAGAWVLAGGVPFGLALAAYHWAVFGGPLAFPYQFGGFAAHREGLVGAQLPDGAGLATVLLSERGLLTLTPIVAVGALGLVAAVRRGAAARGAARGDARGAARGAARGDAVAALVVLAGLVALMAGWPTSDYGGASPGPRYVVPALPWLAGGTALAWASRARIAAAVATAVGAAAMLLATLTLPLVPAGESAVGWWWERATSGDWAPTLVTRAVETGGGAAEAAAVAAPLVVAVGAGLAWRRAERAAPVAVAPPPSVRV